MSAIYCNGLYSRYHKFHISKKTIKCIDNTKNKHIHTSSVRGLNHHCSKHG